METMFASSRRSLPPVPRSTAERATETAAPQPTEPHAASEPAVGGGGTAQAEFDPAQEFVARLRGGAPAFAAAAGARSAVVREAVPPARHRRSRCRVVLRYAEGHEADLTFLGPAGRPGPDTHAGFEAAIQSWLAADPRPENAWLVPDEDAPDGMAVDVTAWAAGG